MNSDTTGELIALWSKTRSPRIADAIDALTTSREIAAWERIGKLPGSRAKTAILRLAKTEDPRLTTLYLKWLVQGNWPAPTAKVVWTRIFEHLGALRDVRAIEPLRAVADALPAFVGAKHRAWVTSSIGGVVNKLAAAKPVNDTAEITAALARVTPQVGDRSRPKPGPDQVVDAVWANPADDDLKAVIADALLERDDPWGELIRIQLRGANATPKERTHAKMLERKHGARWLGPIGRLTLDSSWRFEKGFPVAIGNDRRAVPRRDYEAALHAAQWATIDILRVSIGVTPKWWITEWVRSPASRNVRVFEVGPFKGTGATMRIERELGRPWQLVGVLRGCSSSTIPIWRAFVEGLAPAERARVVVATTGVADRDAHVAELA